jgi:hypothetical protein
VQVYFDAVVQYVRLTCTQIAPSIKYPKHPILPGRNEIQRDFFIIESYAIKFLYGEQKESRK